MKLSILLFPVIFQSTTLLAQNPGKIVFFDDFERNEKDESIEEIGNKWFTNSQGTANGAKQADLQDGALHLETTEKANHRVSLRREIEFRNGTVEMKILLPAKDDTLVMDFADPKEKSVHAGHLFSVTVGADRIEIEDLKTGRSNNAVGKAKKEGKLSKELKSELKSKRSSIDKGIGVREWHLVAATINGNVISVTIDGVKVLDLASEGFAHPTKLLLRIAVPRKAVIDEVRILTND